MFREKRVERLLVPRQLRVGEQLARAIRRIAELEHRSLGEQIIVFLIKGVEQYCREKGKEIGVLLGQL